MEGLGLARVARFASRTSHRSSRVLDIVLVLSKERRGVAARILMSQSRHA
jgi:hypothetical protein